MWWWVRTYLMGFGELFLDEIQDVISLFVLCLALLCVQLILMNTAFVAVITSTFEEVMMLSRQEWMMSLYQLTEDYIARHTTIPVPFNVIYHLCNLVLRILSTLAFGRRKRMVKVRKAKRLEARAGLQVSEESYLKQRFRNPRFRDLEVVPIELLHELEDRGRVDNQKAVVAYEILATKNRGERGGAGGSGQVAGGVGKGVKESTVHDAGCLCDECTIRRVVDRLQTQEKQLKLHILSLRQGSALQDRAKLRYLRQIELKQEKEEQVDTNLRSLSRQLKKMDADVITLKHLVSTMSSSTTAVADNTLPFQSRPVSRQGGREIV